MSDQPTPQPTNEPTESPAAPAPTADAAAPTPQPEPEPATRPEITFDDFIKVDLRVATITAAEPHPNADRLLKLQLDLGPLGTRQICAGIKAYEQPENLINKQIVVVANLAPRKLRGEVSQGMLLAATALPPGASENDPPQDVVLLNTLRPVPPGSQVG